MILLVDDQLGPRRGVELLLRDARLPVAAVAASAGEMRARLADRRFDAVLIDAALAGVSIRPLLAGLRRDWPELPVVVYAGRDEAVLRELSAAPVSGLVLKSSSAEVLVTALRAVAGGGRFRDPGLLGRLPDHVRPALGVERLSVREREILGLLAGGRSGAEIARQLVLSGETVRTHVRNASEKLGARNRTHAVAMLVEHLGGVPVQAGVD